MKIKKQSSLPSKYRLLIFIAVCVIIMGISRVSNAGGPFRLIANYTVIPMQKGISYVGTWLGDFSDNFKTLEELKLEV